MFASPIGAGTEMMPVMCERCNPVSRQDDMDVNPTTSQTDPTSASTGITPPPVDGPHQDRPLEMELVDIEAFRVEPPLGKSHHSSPLHDGPLEQQSVTQGPSLQVRMKCTRDQQSAPTSPTSPELLPCQQHESRLLLGPLGSPIGHVQMPGHLQSSGMPQTCHGDQVWAMGREWESRGGEGGFQPSKANTPPSQTHQISTPSYPAVHSSNYGHSSSSHCPGPFSPSSPVLGSHHRTIGSPHRHPYPQSLPHQSCSPGGCQGPSKYTPQSPCTPPGCPPANSICHRGQPRHSCSCSWHGVAGSAPLSPHIECSLTPFPSCRQHLSSTPPPSHGRRHSLAPSPS